MADFPQIQNGDSGLSTRTKINQLGQQVMQYVGPLASKPDGEDIVIVGAGQSQMGRQGFYTDGVPAGELMTHPLVTVWDTDGAVSPSAYAFRQKDLTDEYVTTEVANECNVGIPTKSATYDTERGHMVFRLAVLLAEFTGRRVRIVNSYRGGTSIDQPGAGWSYDISGTTAGSVLANAVDDAMTALRQTPGNANARVDIVVWAQQALTAKVPEPSNISNYYGVQLATLAENIESPDRWGWGNPDMLWMLLELPSGQTVLGAPKQYFYGFDVARNIIGPERCHIISTEGDRFVPSGQYGQNFPIHWTGETQDMLGHRMHAALTQPASITASNRVGFKELRRLRAFLPSAMPYTVLFEGEADTSPGAGYLNYNADKDTLRISMESVEGFDWYMAGLGGLKIGSALLVSDTASSDAILFQLTSDARYTWDDYFEWDVDVVQESGTLSADDVCSISSFSGDYLFGQDDFVLRTDSHIVNNNHLRSDSLDFMRAGGFQVAGPIEIGGVSRSPQSIIPVGAQAQTGRLYTRHYAETVGDTPLDVISAEFPDNTAWGYELQIDSISASGVAVSSRSIRGCISKGASDESFGQPGDVYASVGTLPAPEADHDDSGLFTLSITGVAAQTWKHTVHCTVWPMLTDQPILD